LEEYLPTSQRKQTKEQK
jgi:hypothetical protein